MDYQALLDGIELGELAPLTSYNQFVKNADGIFERGGHILHCKKPPVRAYPWTPFLERFPIIGVGREGWEPEELKFISMYEAGGKPCSKFGLVFYGDNYESFSIPPADEKHRLRCACDPGNALYLSKIVTNGKGKDLLERHLYVRIEHDYTSGVPHDKVIGWPERLFC